jgi:hypothetical protein
MTDMNPNVAILYHFKAPVMFKNKVALFNLTHNPEGMPNFFTFGKRRKIERDMV